jgi:hypothetical protein
MDLSLIHIYAKQVELFHRRCPCILPHRAGQNRMSEAYSLAHSIFTHHPENELLVCHLCQCGVGSHEVVKHLDMYHSNQVAKPDRRAIETELMSLPAVKLIWDIHHPTSPIHRIRGLALQQDYVMCKADPSTCRHIMAPNRTNQNSHLKAVHNISAAIGGNGEGVRSTIQSWETNITCQRLSKHSGAGGTTSSWFKVFRNTEPTNDIPSEASSAFNIMMNRGVSNVQEVSEGLSSTVPPLDDANTSAWLMKTQWQAILAGLKFKDIQSLVKSPVEEGGNAQEVVLWECIRNLGAVWQNTVSGAGEMLRKEVMRNQMDTVCTEPLIAYAQKRNDKVYVIQEIFMFVWRVVKSGGQAAPPRFKMTKPQIRAWNRIVTHMEQSSLKNLQTEVRSPVGERTTPSHFELLCQDFCLMLLKQSTTTHEHELALLTILAAQAVHDHGFSEPIVYCSIIAAHIKYARFCVLQDAINVSLVSESESPTSSSSGSSQSSVDSAVDSAVDSTGVDGVHAHTSTGPIFLARQYMNSFMIRGTNTSFEWMIDTLSYGYKTAYSAQIEGFTYLGRRDANLSEC